VCVLILLNIQCVFWFYWTCSVCFDFIEPAVCVLILLNIQCVLILLNLQCVFWFYWTCSVCFDFIEPAVCVLILLNIQRVFWFYWTCSMCFDLIEHTVCVLILLNIQCVFWFNEHAVFVLISCTTFVSETSHSTKKWAADSQKKSQISNFILIRPLWREFFHALGWTDGHDEANSLFSQLRESA